MTYGGVFPLGWNQSTSDWREWQYQVYQESLEEEEEDEETDDWFLTFVPCNRGDSSTPIRNR